MRKIFNLVLAVLMVCGTVVYALPSSGPGTGEIRQHGGLASQAHKTFRLVRYVHAGGTNMVSNLTKDAIVIWDTSASGDDGVAITTTSTCGDSRVAGVVISAILTEDLTTLAVSGSDTIGKKNWGWLQTYGLCQVDLAPDTIVAAGDALACGNLSGYAARFALSVDPNSTADDTTSSTQYGIAGFFMDAGTVAQQNVEVFIKCE